TAYYNIKTQEPLFKKLITQHTSFKKQTINFLININNKLQQHINNFFNINLTTHKTNKYTPKTNTYTHKFLTLSP
ncbi:hypothetical protein DF186_23575, partial [Enterococcus hirae]